MHQSSLNRSPSMTNCTQNGDRKDSFQYDMNQVNYPYYYPESSSLRETHVSFRVSIPPPLSKSSESGSRQENREGKSQPFYRTFHRDLKHILKRTELRAHKYTFVKPDPESGREVVHSVLWDYETGHVRISPMFKSSEFDALRKKNTPRRCVNRNGLTDCYASITGGNIEAQGFWIPYLAAKAICSKFCFSIRHALSPIFGNDFPALCEKEYRDIRLSGKTYGAEETIQIDNSIVQAVKAKQVVVEWQLYLEEGVSRSDRQEKLPTIEDAWKQYIITCKGLAIPPRLSYPETQEDVHEQGEGEDDSEETTSDESDFSLPQRVTKKARESESAIERSLENSEKEIQAAIILMELRYGRPWLRSPSPCQPTMRC